MEHLPKDQNLDKFIDADKEEGASAPRLARSDIEQQIKNAEASQSIEAHLVLVDKYLSGEHFSEAGQSIERAKEIIELLPGDFEQKAHFAQGLSRREQLLADLKGELVANADISAIVAHLGHGDLRNIGSSIDMKLKDVEQREVDLTSQNKKMYDELTATQQSLSRKLNGLNLLFILLVVLLAGLFVGGYLLRDKLFLSNFPLATPDAGHEELVNLRSTVESVVAGVLTIPPTPTAVDLASFETRLNEIAAALTPVPTSIITTAITAPVTPTLTIPLPSITVTALLRPTIKNVNDAGEFILTSSDYWFDIPDFSIEIEVDNDFVFQSDASETRYEVVNSRKDNLGALTVQIWKEAELIHEYTYPFVEEALLENSKQLQINWKDTLLPLLETGTYKLRFVTYRGLNPKAYALIGESQEFTISDGIMEVEATVDGQLRSAPVWNCTTYCEKDLVLPLTVDVLGYAIVPFSAEGDQGLSYLIPENGSLSFDEVVTTMEDEEIAVGREFGPGDELSLKINNIAKFFLVRIPDTREYYWLGEQYILQFYFPDTQDDLLALPVFAKQ